MDHRVVEAERDLRKSLAQRPAQSRASYQIRWLTASSVNFWKPPRVDSDHKTFRGKLFITFFSQSGT